MSAIEENCRRAYFKAMGVETVRHALATFGRVIFLDEDAIIATRYVLSRVSVAVNGRPALSLTYCNGVHVA